MATVTPWGRSLLVAFLIATGCGTTGKGPAGDGAEVDSLVLRAPPAPLNLDGQPGSDGLVVIIHAFRRGTARPVELSSGTLEVLLYDGIPAEPIPETVRPRLTRSLSAAQLPARRANSRYGVGYRALLDWRHDRPTTGHITIVARHVAPSGRVAASAPVSIALKIRSFRRPGSNQGPTPE